MQQLFTRIMAQKTTDVSKTQRKCKRGWNGFPHMMKSSVFLLQHQWEFAAFVMDVFEFDSLNREQMDLNITVLWRAQKCKRCWKIKECGGSSWRTAGRSTDQDKQRLAIKTHKPSEEPRGRKQHCVCQFSYYWVSWTKSMSVMWKSFIRTGLHKKTILRGAQTTELPFLRPTFNTNQQLKRSSTSAVTVIKLHMRDGAETQHNTPPDTGHTGHTGHTGTCQVMQEVVYQVTHDCICGQNHQHQAGGHVQHVRRQRDGVSRRRPEIYEGRRICCVRLQRTLRTRRQAADGPRTGRGGKEGVHVDGLRSLSLNDPAKQ